MLVRTAYCLTDPVHPRCGLEQGEVNSPLLWLIFYDALLCALNQSAHGYHFDGIATSIANPGTASLKVPNGGFADDLTLVADSSQGMQALVDICMSFFRLHDIEVNATKTVHVVNAHAETINELAAITLSNDGQVMVPPPKGPGDLFRLLGSWLTLDGKTQPLKKFKAEAQGVGHLQSRKQNSEEIAVYIINSIITPTFVHRAAATALTRTRSNGSGSRR